jgi:hypothetical protein
MEQDVCLSDLRSRRFFVYSRLMDVKSREQQIEETFSFDEAVGILGILDFM